MPQGVYERTPEYREKMRQAQLRPETWDKQRKAKLGRKASPETRAKMSKARLGRPVSPEIREKIRQAHFGLGHTPETREKLRQLNLGKHLSVETRAKIGLANLGKRFSLEHREKIGQGQRRPEIQARKRQASLGCKNPMFGHKYSPETREKMRQARLHRVFPKKMTSIEQLLHDEFKKRRLHFEMHKTMFNRWQPDFVFESARLIVEADGDYWHGLPKSRIKDAAMRAVALAEGWSVWRFGEREIEMHPAACARAVARFVRDHPN